MLYGKFWITPEGVHDVSLSEHALFAKNWLLKLEDHERFKLRDTFKRLTPEQVKHFRARGIPEEVLSLLRTRKQDVRLYMIEQYNWIRTRHSGIYLWRFDDPTLKRIRAAEAFWRRQAPIHPDEFADIHELRPDALVRFAVRVTRLRDPALNAAAIKAKAKLMDFGRG